ncbi:alkaline phosphatase [Methylobacter sp. S3L5C]|uniref:alkaline phosphatase n=1 Tax=Methylobacter sp. S3L5C TaxID=2839024 RepID=UPI001FAB697C|nr:alkaline phosphatase [Methylobacter sp. S3L5C]UOA09477.1 alkaline phosphatase [Methylobacter sp. S3L5C]
MKNRNHLLGFAIAGILATGVGCANALTISRLTPPSQLFATNGATSTPMISRFIQGQRFDLQATVRPDSGKTITKVEFFVDSASVGVANTAPAAGVKTSLVPATAITGTIANAVVASVRGYSNQVSGIRTLTAVATQSDNTTVTATGSFEVVGITQAGRKVKNVIIMLGDGMGASHRTAARIVQNGYAQGKANKKLAMDSFTNTAMIMTASLDTQVTDSAPGMANYVNGNKANSGQEGVWPDDTTAAFDGPRMEYMSEFLARTQGKKLGIVTTADVFDATPAANAIHTSNRGNGTGIVDQFLDDSANTGLTVLMGGGRKWFLPSGTAFGNGFGGTSFTGSARATSSDYTLPADIQAGWNAAVGAIDTGRDLLANFQTAGWTYAADHTALANVGTPAKLLGLFSLSNMNIAKDKMDGRRGVFPTASATTTIVEDYGFPDQPMLDEMATKALQVLDANSPNGFVLMVEGASIDKQSHEMDSTRFMVDTIEFDKAVQKARDYVDGTGDFAGHAHPDTLVYVTADHECSGAAIIGASTKSDAALQAEILASGNTIDTNGQPKLRNNVVGTYAAAGFPKYTIAADGYPSVWDPDNKLLIGYGAGADHYENFRTRSYPSNDSQQPGNNVAPLNAYPRNNVSDTAASRPFQQNDGYFVTGQVPGAQAVHTGGDIPLTAYGRGAGELGGTIDNTDVFFAVMKAVVGGTTK